MKDYGLVSIITPSYNCEKFIESTIDSVLSQTYENWELLITDDHSSDGTQAILKRYADIDSRIKCDFLEKNQGAGVARNNSIKNAKGRYLALLDSDDQWFPHKLERQLQFMNDNHCSVVYSSYMTCDENGEMNGIVVCRKHEDAFSIKCDDRMGALTFMFDMERIGKLFMPTIRRRQDWCYKMLVMDKAKDAYGIKEPLGIYRMASNSLSRKKKKLIKYNIEGYHVTLGWSRLRSFLFFVFLFLPCYIFKRLEYKLINR